MIKVQITLVASPRNHLYRTGQSLIEVGLFRIGSDAKFDHFCDLAYNLDFEPIFDRCYRDVLNQTAQDVHGLISYLRVFESTLELLHFLPVGGGGDAQESLGLLLGLLRSPSGEPRVHP